MVKSIDSAVSAQLTAETPILYDGDPFPKIAPSHGRSEPPSNTRFPGHIRAYNPKGISTSSAISADDRRVSLYFTMGRPFPLKIAPSHGGSGPPSNTWFRGPTRVLNPNCISIGSTVFAGLTSVTVRQIDHATWSVTIDCIYVRSTGDAV